MTIDRLNSLDRTRFVEQVGWVFEHSPWVAEQAWPRRPFQTPDALHRAMVGQVREASRERQLTLLRAHPDLGARIALSVASASEQAAAGLTELGQKECERFTELNRRYRARFGFPFLLAVKGCTAHRIMSAMEQRLSSTEDAELAEALEQVYRIAAFRLHDVLGTGE